MKKFGLISATLIMYLCIGILPVESIVENLNFSKIETEYLVEIMKNSIIIVLAILVINKLNINELAGISRKSTWNSWYLILIPFYLVFIGLMKVKGLNLDQVSANSIILLLISTLSIGFSEELVFRGLVQSLFLEELLKRKRTNSMIFLGIFIPSLIFGLLHLLDFRVDYAASEFAQLFYAIFIGTAFGAILLRTNKLMPLAIIHGLIDFVFSLDKLSMQTHNVVTSKSLVSAIASVVVVAPLFVVGYLIVKKVEVSDIMKKLALSSKHYYC